MHESNPSQRACIDCVHSRMHNVLAIDPPLYCAHPRAREFDNVKGFKAPRCDRARDAQGRCGIGARLFQAKPPKATWVDVWNALAWWR